MSPTMAYSLTILFAYLLGAIPFGFLIARLRGIDIRAVGSGNIGATNVFRCVGKPWGLLTFLCDALKGFIPTFVFPLAIIRLSLMDDVQLLGVLCAGAAIAGHNWPIYLKFKGGKGVATSAGALLGVAWLPVLIGLGAWILVFLLGRYVSIASILSAVIVATTAWLLPHDSLVIPIALTILCFLIAWRHKTNIQRLFKGTEHRFEFGKRKKEVKPPRPARYKP